MAQVSAIALGGEMFEAALVAWIVGLLADKGLSRGKRLVLGKSDQVALQAALRLACQSLMDDVPLSAREPLALALKERLSDPPEIAYDGISTVTDFLIRDLRIRIAPLADPGLTPAGRSYFEEIGVDDAAFADQMPVRLVRAIQHVATQLPALHSLSSQINSDLILGQLGKILDALQSPAAAPAYPAAVGAPAARTTPASGVDRIALTDLLINAILEIPSMSDHDARRVIIGTLRPEIRDTISRSPMARIEVLNTIRTCQNFTGGFSELVSAIRLIEGNSKAMGNLEDTIFRIGETLDVTVDG